MKKIARDLREKTKKEEVNYQHVVDVRRFVPVVGTWCDSGCQFSVLY